MPYKIAKPDQLRNQVTEKDRQNFDFNSFIERRDKKEQQMMSYIHIDLTDEWLLVVVYYFYDDLTFDEKVVVYYYEHNYIYNNWWVLTYLLVDCLLLNL